MMYWLWIQPIRSTNICILLWMSCVWIQMVVVVLFYMVLSFVSRKIFWWPVLSLCSLCPVHTSVFLVDKDFSEIAAIWECFPDMPVSDCAFHASTAVRKALLKRGLSSQYVERILHYFIEQRDTTQHLGKSNSNCSKWWGMNVYWQCFVIFWNKLVETCGNRHVGHSHCLRYQHTTSQLPTMCKATTVG